MAWAHTGAFHKDGKKRDEAALKAPVGREMFIHIPLMESWNDLGGKGP